MTADQATFLLRAARRFARRHPNLANHIDDLHQVAMIAVWRSQATGGLARTVAHREMIDYMRGLIGYAERPRLVPLDAIAHPHAPDDTAERACEVVEAVRVLRSLPPRRQLVESMTACGWKLPEIGAALGAYGLGRAA